MIGATDPILLLGKKRLDLILLLGDKTMAICGIKNQKNIGNHFWLCGNGSSKVSGKVVFAESVRFSSANERMTSCPFSTLGGRRQPSSIMHHFSDGSLNWCSNCTQGSRLSVSVVLRSSSIGLDDCLCRIMQKSYGKRVWFT